MKKFVLLIFILFINFSCQQRQENKVEKAPNFIIILADDLGYGDLGCFGHPTIKTPHLDKMAQEGMKLTQFYMGGCICTPSRAALITGKIPIKNGMTGRRGVFFPDSAGGLPEDDLTIGEAMKSLNYNTACIGKWHLGHLKKHLPLQHGFDYYFGIPYSNDMSPVTTDWNYAHDYFPPTPLIENNDQIESEPDQRNITKRYTDKAIEFIEANKDDPFFLYFPHTFPHTPLYVDDDHTDQSKRGLYGDVVQELDESVGQILEALKTFKLDKNTFVLFTSDNGPWGYRKIDGGSSGLLKGDKGTPWEGGYRVPAIAWMPGTVPANVHCDAIATSIDLLPTMVDMAGGQSADIKDIDGLNISKTFTEMTEIQDQVFYYKNEYLMAMRRGKWKMFVADPDENNDDYVDEDFPLLFNLDEDPSEKFNVAKDFPDVLAEIQIEIDKHIASIPDVPNQLELMLDGFVTEFWNYKREE